MAVTQLGSKALMSIVKVKENGIAQDFYVVRHNAYTSGRTLLLRRYTHSRQPWLNSDMETSAYANCYLDTWFNSSYFNILPIGIREQIAAVTIPYTPGNGNIALSTLSRKVFALSATELGLTSNYANVEGIPLANADTLIITREDDDQFQTTQQTRSPVTDNIEAHWIVTKGPSLFSSTSASSAFGARPAFTLPATLPIDDSGNISINAPPVINYSGSTALGNKALGFTVSYSVSDADGGVVTVTEKMDAAVKRTHPPALDATQQFQAVLPANFQTILNGNHTLTIEATDGKQAAIPVNITFTKSIYNCSITLITPLVADTMPEAMRLTITGSVPSDVVWTAQVCNNANDANPTWENIKPAVVSGYNYIFINKNKTAAKWGINFRITMQRGSSNTGGYIYAIEGGFK